MTHLLYQSDTHLLQPMGYHDPLAPFNQQPWHTCSKQSWAICSNPEVPKLFRLAAPLLNPLSQGSQCQILRRFSLQGSLGKINKTHFRSDNSLIVKTKWKWAVSTNSIRPTIICGMDEPVYFLHIFSNRANTVKIFFPTLIFERQLDFIRPWMCGF